MASEPSAHAATLRLVDSSTLACFLTVMGTHTTPQQIRQWAARGHITRHGKDTRGRTLYEAGEVARHATHRAAA